MAKRIVTIETDHSVHDYLNRGKARYEQYDYQRAITHYTKALQFAPKAPDIYYHRGNAYRYQGDLKNALADYSTAIRLNPYHADAYYQRAAVRRLSRDLAGAVADLQKYLDLCKALCSEDRAEIEQSLRDLKKQLLQ